LSEEIGDFTGWELDDSLEVGHLHPSTDFAALLDSVERQTESSVPLISHSPEFWFWFRTCDTQTIHRPSVPLYSLLLFRGHYGATGAL
jgi:hypothetical protein